MAEEQVRRRRAKRTATPDFGAVAVHTSEVSGTPFVRSEGKEAVVHIRCAAIVHQAALAGLLGGEKSERVGGRVTRELLSAAMDKSGIRSQTELLEYALSKVALEDDYGPKLLEMKGSVPDDVEL